MENGKGTLYLVSVGLSLATALCGLSDQSVPVYLLGLSGVVVAYFAQRDHQLLINERFISIMSNLITDEQKISFAFVPKTAAGNPAKVDGVPVWSVSNTDALDLVVGEDGLSATVSAKGPLGVAQVIVVADADLGAGVRTLTATADVVVVAAEAATVGLVAGTPELK
jgi:hypothetical protein